MKAATALDAARSLAQSFDSPGCASRLPSLSAEAAVATAKEAEHQASTPSGDGPDWNEAIMLWLSWNSTYEKATAKMYKGGNKEKLRAMVNEMEFLRKQAIELSQGLLGCTN